MRILLIAVGRLGKGEERLLTGRYLERTRPLARNAGVSGVDVVEVPEARAASREARLAQEARALLERIPEGAVVVALDERGHSETSENFAEDLRKAGETGVRDVVFLIGGPDGLDETVRRRADRLLAFGRQTMPHQLVRALLAEQIYRALTIIAGHPYHRG